MIRSIFKSRKKKKVLNRYIGYVKQVNVFEQEYIDLSLSDVAILEESTNLRKDLSEVSKSFKSKSDIFKQKSSLKALALIKIASVRATGMRPYDVQLIGAMALVEGSVAEMKTGEGKTLVAPLAAYLFALQSEPVHVITVNDYLARRDAEAISGLLSLLGISVGVIQSNMPPQDRAKSYACDITYGTSSEFGFDYLRDNLAQALSQQVQRGFGFALIDEVDSVLIDESRTPLIISGHSESNTAFFELLYPWGIDFKPQNELEMKEEIDSSVDYIFNQKENMLKMTDKGYMMLESHLKEMKLIEDSTDLYKGDGQKYCEIMVACLKARSLQVKDHDYFVKEGKIVIVDPNTGRAMPDRRWSDGLHQAVEAKEGVEIQPESQTVASITLMNYFSMYKNIGGMTGTAETEETEFLNTFGMSVVQIPTHKPVIRVDEGDRVYLNEEAKLGFIIDEIREKHRQGRPVLVGTASVEQSEKLSELLEAANLKHEVLNAKQHEREALIVANAGKRGAITISTSMAGRGTDILLGGKPDLFETEADWIESNKEVTELGGLHVIGSERNESRRIDDQLRGRAGRQGDPGSSVFFVSLDDKLLEHHGGPKIKAMVESFGAIAEEDEISSNLLTKSIRRAQERKEEQNAGVRKSLMRFDDVISSQRSEIYELRQGWMQGDVDVAKLMNSLLCESIERMCREYIPLQSFQEQWDLDSLCKHIKEVYQLNIENLEQHVESENLDDVQAVEFVRKILMETAEKLELYFIADDNISAYYPVHAQQKAIATVDELWRKHLTRIYELQDGIHLRSYANKKPNEEFSKEAYEMFGELLISLEDTLSVVYMSMLFELYNMKIMYDNQQAARNQIEQEKSDHVLSPDDKLESHDLSDNFDIGLANEVDKQSISVH